MGSALFGSPFLATIYFGPPGVEGHRVPGRLLCPERGRHDRDRLHGTLGIIVHYIPVEAGMALIIWIGLAMTAQAFEVVPARHIPAVVVGLVPALGAYTEFVIKRTLLAVGFGTPGHPIPATLNALFSERADYYSAGVFALGEGYIYTCIVLSAATVQIIERRFMRAAGWFAAGGGVGLLGLANNYRITDSDIVGVFGFAPGVIPLAYFMMACICALVGWATTAEANPPSVDH